MLLKMYQLLLVLLAFALFAQNSTAESELSELREEDLDNEDGIDMQGGQIMPFDCECGNSTCQCCGRLAFNLLRLNETACVEIAYNGKKTALQATIKMGNKVLFRGKISANKPPPICVGPPNIRLLSDVCFKFYDVQLSLDDFNVCLNVVPRLMRNEIKDLEVEVGCMGVNSNSSASSVNEEM